MALKKYRRQIIRVRDANDELPEIILSTGDEAGRIIQLQITNGENYGTQCRFWLQKEEGVNVFQDMEQVTAPYPTWEAAINTGGLEPGVYQAMFRVGDNDGSVTETFRTTARVLQGMLVEGEETEEMQSQLNEFEQRTEDALAANAQATQAATTAAEAATAATDAIEHALDSVDVRILDTGVLSVTNVDGVPTSYDVKQQVSNAINPKIEDAEAATQRANTAADDANTATDAANRAAGSVDASIEAANTALNNMGANITGGVITVHDKDATATTYNVKGYVDSELAQPLADAASATEAANTAASEATAAKNAANTAASEAASAKTAAETATTEAQAATTAATNAATAANNAAQTALASVGNMLIGEYADAQGGQIFTTEDAYATGALHGLTVYGKSTQVQDPAPTPDTPQEIKSVADGNVKITGKCIWGGEQMADDIVAAFNDTSLGWKGEDSNGRYVAVKATSTSNIFFKIKKVFNFATLVLKIRKTAANKPTNFAMIRQDGSVATLTLDSDAIIGEVQKVAFVRDNIIGVRNSNGSSIAYIYYDESGLFEGTLTVDDFVPYASDTLHFLPDGIEPLRSLPDGTRDVLRIDKDGNGVIERNVKKVIINGNSVFNFEDSNRLAYFSAHWMKRVMDYRQTMISNTLPINNNQTRAEQKDYMAFTGYYSTVNPGRNYLYVSDVPLELQTTSALSNYFSQHVSEVLCALATPTTETIPASVMPQIPSEYLNAWLDASDQNGDAINPAWGMEYERDLTVTINNIESAIADIVSA